MLFDGAVEIAGDLPREAEVKRERQLTLTRGGDGIRQLTSPLEPLAPFDELVCRQERLAGDLQHLAIRATQPDRLAYRLERWRRLARAAKPGGLVEELRAEAAVRLRKLVPERRCGRLSAGQTHQQSHPGSRPHRPPNDTVITISSCSTTSLTG